MLQLYRGQCHSFIEGICCSFTEYKTISACVYMCPTTITYLSIPCSIIYICISIHLYMCQSAVIYLSIPCSIIYSSIPLQYCFIHLSFPLHHYLSVYPPLAALSISVAIFAALSIQLSIPLHHLLFFCQSPCSTMYPPIHPCNVTYPYIHIFNTSVWFKGGGWPQQKTFHLLIQNASPLGTSFAPSLLSYAF